MARAGVGGLVVLAFGVRAVVAATSFDVPGDGPSRALAVWEWLLQDPHLVTFGFWPPGPTYLAAVVGVWQPDSLWTMRILNVIVGSASVAVLYR